MTTPKGVPARKVKNSMRVGRSVKTDGLSERSQYPEDSGKATSTSVPWHNHNVKRVFWSPAASLVMFVTATHQTDARRTTLEEHNAKRVSATKRLTPRSRTDALVDKAL